MKTLLALCIACVTVALPGAATAQTLCRLRDLRMPHVTQNRDGAWQLVLDRDKRHARPRSALAEGQTINLTAPGTETRRALVLILHDASQPAKRRATDCKSAAARG